jgi:Na+-transporting NADH:ubiquinone oxidoreductase subunit NqrB
MCISWCVILKETLCLVECVDFTQLYGPHEVRTPHWVRNTVPLKREMIVVLTL